MKSGRRPAQMRSNRRLYLCCYDVVSSREGDRRRNRLFELLLDHGEHVQYSVFLCELTAGERLELVSEGRSILNEKEDQLLVLDIGPAGLDWAACLFCVGKPWQPQTQSFIV